MVFEEREQVPGIQTKYLKRGATLSLTIKDDACLRVIYGEGGGCILEAVGGAAGVWIPLRGSVQVHGAKLNRPVRTGEVLVSEQDNCVKAIGHANGLWLAVLGGKRAWEWLLAEVSAVDARLLPEMHRADHELRRKTISLARATLPLELEGAVHVLADRVVNLQAPLHEAIARCPGRTFASKRQAFLRLQRVRNYISAFCYQDLDNETLALMANFSPCYFLRMFKNVYLETPHAYLVNQRLQRARQLLHSSNLAITEVALASGFENRCVFSRTFHRRFGVTAKEARYLSATLSGIG